MTFREIRAGIFHAGQVCTRFPNHVLQDLLIPLKVEMEYPVGRPRPTPVPIKKRCSKKAALASTSASEAVSADNQEALETTSTSKAASADNNTQGESSRGSAAAESRPDATQGEDFFWDKNPDYIYVYTD